MAYADINSDKDRGKWKREILSPKKRYEERKG